MKLDPVQTVIGYHDRTKHHPGRYARSLGYLDWATQPDPFRRFVGAPLLKLPIPPDRSEPRYDELFVPGAVVPEAITVESISTFFYLSLSLSAWKQAGGSRWALRCNPSSGNLHPTEGYAVLPPIVGLGERPGVYHYAPREHALEQRAMLSGEVFESLIRGVAGVETQAEGADRLLSSCFVAGLSSVYWREAWKYGERAFRYCHHDVGHALASLRMAAATLGWRLVVLEGQGDDDVARVLGLDRTEDFAGAEPEHPDLLAVVFPADMNLTLSPGLDTRLVDAIAASAWAGRANQLSPDHVDWDVIDAVAHATFKPRLPVAPVRVSASPPISSRRSADQTASAFHIIRTRRSALAFDGQTGMSVETFYRMLARVVPIPARTVAGARVSGGEPRARSLPPPWDAVSGAPRVHLFLFVHLVNGLPPGIYALVRDPERVDELKEACDRSFNWSVPDNRPESLPLFMLAEADCRRAAAQLSLGQDIAGMSAFSLGMVAEFARPLDEHGAWIYRRLFWETGMIGQVLYLESEAAGLRATGIGAFFDDLVHETLGLSNRDFQTLYHFTVGGAVEDPRIMSAPAYPPPMP